MTMPSEEMFNEDQRGHMKWLGTIPRERRCPSGWHAKDEQAAQEYGLDYPCRCKRIEKEME